MRDRIMQRLQRDHHLDGRAIGIGDDVALTKALKRFAVHLRHDQRHVRVHAEMGRVVDHGAAGFRGTRRVDLGNRSAW